jgi:hypothetical protein
MTREPLKLNRITFHGKTIMEVYDEFEGTWTYYLTDGGVLHNIYVIGEQLDDEGLQWLEDRGYLN